MFSRNDDTLGDRARLDVGGVRFCFATNLCVIPLMALKKLSASGVCVCVCLAVIGWQFTVIRSCLMAYNVLVAYHYLKSPSRRLVFRVHFKYAHAFSCVCLVYMMGVYLYASTLGIFV